MTEDRSLRRSVVFLAFIIFWGALTWFLLIPTWKATEAFTASCEADPANVAVVLRRGEMACVLRAQVTP